MINNNIKNTIQNSANKFLQECFHAASWLTANPELSWKETKGSKYIGQFLESKGYQVEYNFKGIETAFLAIPLPSNSVPATTGVTSTTKIQDQSPTQVPGTDSDTIVLMCEYDALPELGHACGHSISGMISVLTALTLTDAFKDLDVNIHIMGTPAEEFGGGKIKLLEAEAFDNYKLAAMAHLYGTNAPWFNSLAATSVTISYTGKSAHASNAPWEGNNALNGSQLLFHASDMMRQHLPKGYQVHGIISNGGTSANVVPDFSSAIWYQRAGNLNELTDLQTRMATWANGCAMATETSVEIKSNFKPYGEIAYNPSLIDLMSEVFDLYDMPYSHMETPGGSTDAGNVDYLIPVLHPMIKIGNTNPKLHTKEFQACVASEEAGKETLLNGALVLATAIYELVSNDKRFNELLANRKK